MPVTTACPTDEAGRGTACPSRALGMAPRAKTDVDSRAHLTTVIPYNEQMFDI